MLLLSESSSINILIIILNVFNISKKWKLLLYELVGYFFVFFGLYKNGLTFLDIFIKLKSPFSLYSLSIFIFTLVLEFLFIYFILLLIFSFSRFWNVSLFTLLVFNIFAITFSSLLLILKGFIFALYELSWGYIFLDEKFLFFIVL